MSDTMRFSVGSGYHLVNAILLKCGDDIVVVVGGGTRPHVGAVAVAISHSSIKDPNKLTTTASILTVPGHKEDQLVRSASLRLAKALRTTVTVSAGLHVDEASQKDIDTLVSNFDEVVDAIISDLAPR